LGFSSLLLVCGFAAVGVDIFVLLVDDDSPIIQYMSNFSLITHTLSGYAVVGGERRSNLEGPQMISTRQVLASLGLALVVGVAPACSSGHGAARFAAGASASMPFEYFRGTRIILPVKVNGHPVDAVLDSGAGVVTLDKAFAAEIGIVPTGKIPVNGMNGGGEAAIAKHVTIDVGGLQLRDVEVAIVDLSAVAAGLGRPLPLILGRDAFDAAVVDIDFPARKIAFHDPAAFHPPASAIRLPLSGTPDRQREVPMSLEGGAPVRTTFDLGSSTAVYVSHDYAVSHHLLKTHPAAEILAGGFGGSAVQDITTLKSIRLGGVELRNVPAIINRSASDLPSKGMNVGMPVLNRFRLMIDFHHDAVFMLPNKPALAEPFGKDRTGLGTRFAGDHLNVAFVAPGGPADRAGWKVGEKISAVAAEPVGPGFYSGPHAGWAMSPAGESLELTVGDGSKRRLVLQDYY
jgi:hypothetical protein